MTIDSVCPCDYSLRAPADPIPSPIPDPIDPPENPDVPVREPEPDIPGQMRLQELAQTDYMEPLIAQEVLHAATLLK